MSTNIDGAGDALVNTTTFDDQAAPAIVKLADGWVVVWQSQQAPADYFNPHFPPGSDIYLQRYDTAGHAVSGETHVNTVAINDQVQPVVSASAGGGFTIAWASAREQGMTSFDKGIYFQRFDAQGNALGGETQANSFYNLDQARPAIASLANGDGFVVTWWSDVQSTNPPGLYMRRFGADGSALTPETRVGTATAGSQSDAVVAALQAGFVMAWDAAGGVYSQRFDNGGAALAAPVQVNTSSANGLAQPAIAALHDGGYAVAWQSDGTDGSAIHVQRYDAGGAAMGSEATANTTPGASQAAITALDDGGYAVAWTAADAVFAQRFDAGGHAVGGPAQVNKAASATAFDAALASDGHNGFIAAWTSGGHDGNGSGVYAIDVAAPSGTPHASPGPNGVDTAVVHGSASQVSAFSIAGGNLSITTTAGTQQFTGAERVKFDDAMFALDTQAPSATSAGGHTWQAEALLWAALGTAPDVSLLSQWTAAADASANMAGLGQAIIDHYAPGITSAELVTYLYTQLAHTAPSQGIVDTLAAEVGAGHTFATQGDLYAYAANLPVNTDHLAGFTGSIQPLDPGWFA